MQSGSTLVHKTNIEEEWQTYWNDNSTFSIEAIDDFISRGADLNKAIHHHKRTALHVAAEKGFLEIVKHLVELGAIVNAKEYLDRTPMVASAFYKHYEVMQWLIEKGADVNILKKKKQYSPLFLAAERDELALVTYLLAKGADANVVDDHGNSLMHELSRQSPQKPNCLAIMQLLRGSGADVTLRNKCGETALYRAAQNGNWDIVRYLVEQGADINAVEKFDNKTALHCAAQRGNLDIAQYLVERGADINAVDLDCKTPLHRAVNNGNLDLVQYLVAGGAHIHIRDKLGNTALDLVAKPRKGQKSDSEETKNVAEIVGFLKQKEKEALQQATTYFRELNENDLPCIELDIARSLCQLYIDLIQSDCWRSDKKYSYKEKEQTVEPLHDRIFKMRKYYETYKNRSTAADKRSETDIRQILKAFSRIAAGLSPNSFNFDFVTNLANKTLAPASKISSDFYELFTELKFPKSKKLNLEEVEKDLHALMSFISTNFPEKQQELLHSIPEYQSEEHKEPIDSCEQKCKLK